MVTIMSPDGKPIQVSASSLQTAGVQNQTGIYNIKRETKNCPKIVNKSKVHLNWVSRFNYYEKYDMITYQCLIINIITI